MKHKWRQSTNAPWGRTFIGVQLEKKIREAATNAFNRIVLDAVCPGIRARIGGIGVRRVVPDASIFRKPHQMNLTGSIAAEAMLFLMGDNGQDTYILAYAHMISIYVNANRNDNDCRRGCSAGQGA